MYHFITKNEYFSALEDPEIGKKLNSTMNMGLKHVQDACLLKQIMQNKTGAIAEIGGGNSRTLSFFRDRGWECFNIDPFEGVGNGPVKLIEQPGIKNILSYLGPGQISLEKESLDVIYSISVIEHIPNTDLPSFFSEIHRLLKSGGITIHMIDCYLDNTINKTTQDWLDIILKNALGVGLKLSICESPIAKFDCSYATNPDLIMRAWNKIAPQLTQKRYISQSTTLILYLEKK